MIMGRHTEYEVMIQKGNPNRFNLKVVSECLMCPVTVIFLPLFLFLFLLIPLRSGSSQTEDAFTWKTQKSGVFSRFSAVFFVDRQRGWIVGSNGTMIATEDGGQTWQKQVLPERQKREVLRDVWYIKKEDATDYILLLGEYGIVNPRGVYNITDRTFALYGPGQEESWREAELARQPYRRPDKILGRMKIDDAGRVQVKDPDDYQETLRTPEPVLLRVSFVNNRVGWACGESGAIQSTADGGISWRLQYAQTRKLLYDVSAIDEMEAWVVGAGGTILHTADGGQRWDPQKSGLSEALRGVHFVDSELGWAVGANGKIISTADGGKYWRLNHSGTTKNLNDVFFLNAREGWAAGDNGTLLHTRNGGVTWEDDTQETHANFTRLFFIAPDCGWVVGNNGVIFKYMSR
jgi:photosystem II stability/assembly factor-like uncharacterized protein